MPRPSKARRTYTKKRRTYRKNYRKPTSIPLSIQPKYRLGRLRYTEQFNLNATAGTIAYNDLCANGLYDPNLTGVGHQPYGFDQIMTLYNHYVVLGSRITCQFLIDTATSGIPAYAGVALCPTTAVVGAFSNVNHFLESGTVPKKQVIVSNNNMGNSNGKGGTRISMNFSTKKYFNRSPRDSDELQGNSSANPSEQAIFTVYAASVIGTDPQNIVCLATIDYICLFTEVQQLAQS